MKLTKFNYIRSLSKHHDTLHTQLSKINIPFDMTGMPEIKDKLTMNSLQI